MVAAPWGRNTFREFGFPCECDEVEQQDVLRVRLPVVSTDHKEVRADLRCRVRQAVVLDLGVDKRPR